MFGDRLGQNWPILQGHSETVLHNMTGAIHFIGWEEWREYGTLCAPSSGVSVVASEQL